MLSKVLQFIAVDPSLTAGLRLSNTFCQTKEGIMTFCRHAAWGLFCVATLSVCSRAGRNSVHATDWPMLGRDITRNSVSPEQSPPTDWDVTTGRNIKWKCNSAR